MTLVNYTNSYAEMSVRALCFRLIGQNSSLGPLQALLVARVESPRGALPAFPPGSPVPPILDEFTLNFQAPSPTPCELTHRAPLRAGD